MFAYLIKHSKHEIMPYWNMCYLLLFQITLIADSNHISLTKCAFRADASALACPVYIGCYSFLLSFLFGIYRYSMYMYNLYYSGTPLVRPPLLRQKSGLSRGVKISIFMFRFTLSRGLSRGGGLSSGWPLKRGSTVLIYLFVLYYVFMYMYLLCHISIF